MFDRKPSVVVLNAVRTTDAWAADILIDGYLIGVLGDGQNWRFGASGIGPKLDKVISRAFKDWLRGQEGIVVRGSASL
jgi:hypothetical protein